MAKQNWEELPLWNILPEISFTFGSTRQVTTGGLDRMIASVPGGESDHLPVKCPVRYSHTDSDGIEWYTGMIPVPPGWVIDEEGNRFNLGGFQREGGIIDPVGKDRKSISALFDDYISRQTSCILSMTEPETFEHKPEDRQIISMYVLETPDRRLLYQPLNLRTPVPSLGERSLSVEDYPYFSPTKPQVDYFSSPNWDWRKHVPSLGERSLSVEDDSLSALIELVRRRQIAI